MGGALMDIISFIKAKAALLKAQEADTKANDVKAEFDRVVAEAGSNNPEVVQARGEAVNLNARLDANDEHLAERPTHEEVDEKILTVNTGGTIDLSYKADVTLVDDVIQRIKNINEVSSDIQIMRDSIKVGGNKGVVAIRFDDNDYTVYQNAFPLLKERGFPFTSTLVADREGNYPERTKLTDAQIREMANHGMEISNHSFTHESTPTTAEEIHYEVVEAKKELESSFGYYVRNIVKPGTWANDSNMNLELNKIILETHSFCESFDLSQIPNRPIYSRIGINHKTGDSQTAEVMKKWVDDVAGKNKCVIIMFHSIGDIINGISGATIEDFTELLDHIKAYRDQGLLEVLTDSGLIANTIGEPYNHLTNGDFERVNTVGIPEGFNPNPGGSPLIDTTNPRSGTNALKVNASNYVTSWISCYGMKSPVFKVTAWHRSDDGGTARITINDAGEIRTKSMPSTTTWQKIEIAFSMPMSTERFLLYLQPTGTWVVFDDVTVTRIG
jgi:peptidoglycan/xylan/chitin deacetylase (PgdA/CDA1 family)